MSGQLTKAQFTLPVSMGCVLGHGCPKWRPCTVHAPWRWPMNTC